VSAYLRSRCAQLAVHFSSPDAKKVAGTLRNSRRLNILKPVHHLVRTNLRIDPLIASQLVTGNLPILIDHPIKDACGPRKLGPCKLKFSACLRKVTSSMEFASELQMVKKVGNRFPLGGIVVKFAHERPLFQRFWGIEQNRGNPNCDRWCNLRKG
jgi:hypothetical protein